MTGLSLDWCVWAWVVPCWVHYKEGRNNQPTGLGQTLLAARLQTTRDTKAAQSQWLMWMPLLKTAHFTTTPQDRAVTMCTTSWEGPWSLLGQTSSWQVQAWTGSVQLQASV